jgi:ribose transport system ATP-binding protein
VAAAWKNEIALLGLLVFAFLGFGLIDPAFLSLGNLFSIAQQTAVIAVVAFAMTAIIIARGIDISVGSTLALSGIVGAQTFGLTGSPAAAIAATILTGAVVGLINGGLVGLAGISSFMATLATMAFARGLALSLSRASSVPVSDPILLWPGSGALVLPAPVLVALVCLAAWWGLLRRTVYGCWVYAVGGNDSAARASLVPVARVQAIAYVLAGASAGIGAIITVGRLGSAQPLAGAGLEFAAITAAIIGGTKLSGGEGSVLGTAIGALLLGVISTGLSFLQVEQEIIYLVTGGLIIVAVLTSQSGAVAGLLASIRRRQREQRAPAAVGSGAATGLRRSLAVRGLGKGFPGVRALDHVTFAIEGGGVVALAGENGAGKSTLVKCLSGVYRPDDGDIVVDGTIVHFRSPNDAAGISVIHQHFSLVPDLSVMENIFLGREPRTFFGTLDRRRMAREARRVLAELRLDIDPSAELGSLTVGQRQMVEIARAVVAEAWLFIMDEPTSALSNRERDQLYDLIRSLAGRGAAILYISHKLEEILSLADRIVVLRDGRLVATRPTAETSERQLIELMVGRSIGSVFPWKETAIGGVLVRVEDVSDGGKLAAASLSLRSGEIVALAGLMGSGRSEVLRCIAGLAPYRTGAVIVDGQKLPSGDQHAASRAGVVYVPEDRHREGFVGPLSVRDNLGMVWMRGRKAFGLLDRPGLASLAERLVRSLGIRPPQPGKKTIELSGGNQQKVVIGKWLATAPRILLLDEPTRGVDVGAKSELHELIARFKSEGAAILMVSSELPEVLGVADRIIVMHAGRVAGELPRGSSESAVMALAFGRAVEAPV